MCWSDYSQRSATRREHALELQSCYGFVSFSRQHAQAIVKQLAELAIQTDRGIVIATAMVSRLRAERILLPPLQRIERLCAEVITRGERQIYQRLTQALVPSVHQSLEAWLEVPEGKNSERKNSEREAPDISIPVSFSRPHKRLTPLRWLHQPPGAPNAKHLIEHIARLQIVEALCLPEEIGRTVPHQRLLKLARQGAAMSTQDLMKLETQRRLAILVALAVELRATLIDEIVELHDRILGVAFNRAKRGYEEQLGQASQDLRDQVRLYGAIGTLLLRAREHGNDAFDAIESVLSWEEFERSVTAAQQLVRKAPVDFMPRLSESYGLIHRYAPLFLEGLCTISG